jgi:hypothetical protein
MPERQPRRCATVTDCRIHRSDAQADQILSDDVTEFESAENHDEEHVADGQDVGIFRQQSGVYSGADSDGYSVLEIGRFEEIYTSGNELEESATSGEELNASSVDANETSTAEGSEGYSVLEIGRFEEIYTSGNQLEESATSGEELNASSVDASETSTAEESNGYSVLEIGRFEEIYTSGNQLEESGTSGEELNASFVDASETSTAEGSEGNSTEDDISLVQNDVASTAEDRQRTSQEVGTSCHQHFDAFTTEGFGASSSSSSTTTTRTCAGARLPVDFELISSGDEDTDITWLSTRKMQEPPLRRFAIVSSDGSDSECERVRMRIMCANRCAEKRSSVTDGLHAPDTHVQRARGTGGSVYESEPVESVPFVETEDVSLREPTPRFSAESFGNFGWDTSGFTQRLEEILSHRHPRATSATEEAEGRSEEVKNMFGQSYSAFRVEHGESTLPSSSSRTVCPAELLSGSSSETCPICCVKLGALETGTPDCCDHVFCTRCLHKWSAKVNTCPFDRQEFNAILVRHYPDGEIIGRIPVRSRDE